MVGPADALSACSLHENKYGATGLFEVTEVIMSAKRNGKLFQPGVAGGSEASKGQQVDLMDTVRLTLRARQAGANSRSIANQRPDVNTQMVALGQQLKQVEQERQRSEGLANDGTANRKQPDNTTSVVRVLKRQLAA